jgi:hypothetical protein
MGFFHGRFFNEISLCRLDPRWDCWFDLTSQIQHCSFHPYQQCRYRNRNKGRNVQPVVLDCIRHRPVVEGRRRAGIISGSVVGENRTRPPSFPGRAGMSNSAPGAPCKNLFWPYYRAWRVSLMSSSVFGKFAAVCRSCVHGPADHGYRLCRGSAEKLIVLDHCDDHMLLRS